MNAAYALYALAAIALVFLAHRHPRFDLRLTAGDLWPLPDAAPADEAAYLSAREEARAAAAERARLRAVEGLDRTLLLWAAALAAALAGALLGFLGPLLIEAVSAPAAQAASAVAGPRAPSSLATLSYAAERPLGRLAQIVGLVSGALLGLRLGRVFIGLGALGLLVLGSLAATNFVLGRPLFGLFGG